MKIKRFPFWLRFLLFLGVFAVAFFLLAFVAYRNPGDNLQMLFIKIGILATVASLFYNIIVRSESKAID